MEETPAPRFWTRKRRLWLGGATAVILLLAAALYWLPGIGLRYGLVRGLKDLGWSEASVRGAELSLLGGAIVIHRIEAGEDKDSLLGIAGLDVDFRWRPLFSRRLSLNRLDLTGVAVEVRRNAGGFVVNGLPLAVGGGAEATEKPGWSYDVTALTLTDSRILFSDGAVKADIQVESLLLEDLKSWEPDSPARFQLIGRLNGAAVALEGTATPYAARPAFTVAVKADGLDAAAFAEPLRKAGGGQLAGKARADLTLAGDSRRMTAEGRLELANAAWSLDGLKAAAATLAFQQARLAWQDGRLDAAGTLEARDLAVEDGGVTVRAALARLQMRKAGYDSKAARLDWDGTAHAEGHSVAIDDFRMEHATLDWDGATRFDLAPASPSFVHAEGQARTTGIRIASGALELAADKAAVQGVFEHARPAGMLPPLGGRMTATIDKLRIAEGETDWLNAGRLEVADLRLTPGRQANLAKADIRDLAALARRGTEAYPWRLRAGRAVLEQAVLAPDGATSAASLDLRDAVIRITQTKDGIQGLPQAGGGENGGTPPPRQSLGRLSLGGDSRIDFTDRSRSEPVRLRMEAVEAQVADLDTGRPDRDTRFSASARIGSASLKAEGAARPFAEQPGGALKGSVRALELPALSPYAADTLGVYLQTGQLDADLDLNAVQGRLGGGMQLTLSELFVSQPDPNAPLAKRADMPVETVLDLLRDSDNRIRLSIPVRGDLSNPDFDVSDAVGQAVGGALRTTVFTTFKVAFPLAGLISLAIEGGGQRLALAPLGFDPGDPALSAMEQKRLDEVAQLMRQRSSLRLTLCGAATEAEDWPALAERRNSLLGRLQAVVTPDAPADPARPDRDRLARLADARAQAAKTYLADRAGIDPGRLFTCRPRVEAGGESGKPRVDMVL